MHLSARVSTLLLLALLTFFAGLGRQAIRDTDEGFYAEAAREMVESGDWLTPHFNYEDRWQKPILYYWLSASLYLITGPTEWSARFFSALAGVGLVILTWRAARRLMHDDEVAFVAGAITATCYGYFTMARSALPDLPLTFFITWCIYAALERQWLASGVAAGLGFLTKGPVGIVIPAIVLIPIWWRERSWPATRGVVTAGAAAAIVGLPWYVAMWMTHGTAYLDSFFVGDNLERFATTRFNGPRFVLYYLPIVLGGMVPWAMYLLVLPWTRGMAVVRRRARLTESEWRLLIWIAAPLVFYTIAVGKQPRYILPVLPPLAILLGSSIAKRIRAGYRDGDRAAMRGLRTATWLTALQFLIVAVLLFRARALFITAHPLVTIAAVSAIVAAGAVLAWIAWRGHWRTLPPVMAGASAVAMLAIQFGALAGVRPEPVETIAEVVRREPRDTRLGVYKPFVRDIGFYAGRRREDLPTEGVALDFIRSSERVLLVVKARDAERLTAISGIPLQRLGEAPYVDPGNIRLRTLLAPLPDQDVETVLLVANR